MTGCRHLHQRSSILINEDQLYLHRPTGFGHLTLDLKAHGQGWRRARIAARSNVVEQSNERLSMPSELIRKATELAID